MGNSAIVRLIFSTFLLLGSCLAGTAQEWVRVESPDEVRSLVTNRTLVMYQSRQQYHRSDGNMVEYFAENNSYMVRKWAVNEDGLLCWMIFTIPDRVIDCSEIQRGPDGAMRYKWKNAQGAPPLKVLEATPADLIDELDAKAGIVQ